MNIQYYITARKKLVKQLKGLQIQRNITNNKIKKTYKKMSELDETLFNSDDSGK